MNELIKITISENQEPTMSGRELHEFLEVGTKYSDWFSRMVAYGFVENEDYILVTQKRATNNPKNPETEITDHILKLDMAKEIAMIQRSDKGKIARQYFLQIEKDWNSPEKIMARALIMANKNLELKDNTIRLQEQLIGELKPKADYLDDILKSRSLLKITAIAKDYGMSGQAMNDLLHELRVQYKSGKQWLLYAKYQACGYTHSETISFERSDGRPDVSLITKWTQKGRLFLYETLKKNGVIPVIEQEKEPTA